MDCPLTNNLIFFIVSNSPNVKETAFTKAFSSAKDEMFKTSSEKLTKATPLFTSTPIVLSWGKDS